MSKTISSPRQVTMNPELRLQRHERETNLAVPADRRSWGGVQSVTTNSVLFGAFVIGMAWTPFLYGGNDLRGWGVNGLLFPGLAVVHEINILVQGKRHAVGMRELAIPAVFFFAVVVWIVMQNATWTPD